MQAQPNADEIFEIDGRQSALKRAFFLAVGLLCIIVPAWDLRQAFFQFGWWSLFPGAIVLGAWALGGLCLAGAIAGESLLWIFRNGALVVERSSLVHRKTQIIRARDVARTEIRAVDWDSGPDTFRVVLHLKSRQSLETPDHATRAEAEALEAEIRARLWMPQLDVDGRRD